MAKSYVLLLRPVVAEVVLASERLAAEGAGEGALVRVGPHVDLEVVRLGEVTSAELTHVLLAAASAAAISRRPHAAAISNNSHSTSICNLNAYVGRKVIGLSNIICR